MGNTEIMQGIKADIMMEQDCTTDQAVRYIAKLISRSPASVYEYLSINRQDIPPQLLELLQLKMNN